MSPLAAKLLGIGLLIALFFIFRLLFRNTLKGEAGASNLLFIAFVPIYGAALPLVVVFLFKAVYYMF